VPFYSCVDVYVCTLNHLSRVHRSPACVWQKIARTPNQGRNFAGEARGISGFAPELRGPFGARPAKPVVEHHMPFGEGVEGEAVRTAHDSTVARPMPPELSPGTRISIERLLNRTRLTQITIAARCGVSPSKVSVIARAIGFRPWARKSEHGSHARTTRNREINGSSRRTKRNRIPAARRAAGADRPPKRYG